MHILNFVHTDITFSVVSNYLNFLDYNGYKVLDTTVVYTGKGEKIIYILQN